MCAVVRAVVMSKCMTVDILSLLGLFQLLYRRFLNRCLCQVIQIQNESVYLTGVRCNYMKLRATVSGCCEK